MAQPATNPKIEELRFKVKTDPKSRLFFPLAEELRKAGQVDEAEQVLRSGLSVYPTYLAAWVSLGRVLREQRKDEGAVEVLSKALQLDPGNVVAARILADSYLALGQKVEAIKKYKLVYALMPADEELRATIDQLDRDIRGAEEPPASEAEDPVAGSIAEPFDESPAVEAEPVATAAAEPDAAEADDAIAAAPAPLAAFAEEESPFDKTTPPFADAAQSLGEEMRREEATADVEPMTRAHDDSPFEDPVDAFSSDALKVEAPLGVQIASAPLAADVPAYVDEELPPADAAPVFDTTPSAGGTSDDAASTVTMADLYVRQGLIEEARHIYESILGRDPGNDDVRAKLAAISPRVNRKVAQLERWLAKVSRREVAERV